MTTYTKQTMAVAGMSCAGCAARVERTLKAQPGVRTAAVNLAAATALVEYDKSTASAESLQAAVRRIGFDLIVRQDGQEAAQTAYDLQGKRHRQLKRHAVLALAAAIPTAVIGMFFPHVPGAGLAMWLLSTPVIFWLGRGFFANAWKLLRHGSANMDTLVAASTGIAYVYSLTTLFAPELWQTRGIVPHPYFESAAVVVAFVLLGRLLESRAKGDTTSAIRRLIGLRPRTVTRVASDGTTREIAVEETRPDDLLLARPGERIAADGTVAEGSSFVDESMLSGEPSAVRKAAGDTVFAGTVNQCGAFKYRADKVGQDTALAHIVRLVQEAQGSKAPVQKLADRVAAVFVPAVMCLAALSFVCWTAFAPHDGFAHGLQAAITVLVIACPCALGLATPTAVMVGVGKGATNGILIRDAESLERARQVDTVVFDKTGTLTVGRPAVTDTFFPHDDGTALRAACALEQLSEHPLGEAMTALLSGPAPRVEQFSEHPGAGVSGLIDGKTYRVGSRKLLADNGIAVSLALESEATRLAADARTVVWVACEKEAVGIAAIADSIRPEAAEAVGRLRQQGVDVWMLTGDNPATAAAVARQTGIAHFRAGMSPAGKARFIATLQANGHHVAMTGDGINDSAALARADLGIAMGQGSDIAIEASGMTILSPDIRKVPSALRLSAATVRTIRENLFWAFFYNLVSIPVAAGALYPLWGIQLDPMAAGAAMALSSVSVVLNSLRLSRKRI